MARITVAGEVTEIYHPNSSQRAYFSYYRPDSAISFSESMGNNIGRITTAGAITAYPVPTAVSNPGGHYERTRRAV